MSHRKLLHRLQTAADNPFSVMETRPRRQYHIKAKLLKKVLKKHFERDGNRVRLSDITKDFLLTLRDIRTHATTQRGDRQKGAAMVTRRFWRATGVLATAVVVATVSVVAAQSSLTTPTRADASSSDELLTEIRGLRADLQQAAKISIRAQLLVARLQLQEQRINVVGGQRLKSGD
jgi:hypothetical protein